MREGQPNIDLKAARSRCQSLSGEGLWRSLEELARTDEFRESIEREFPASMIEEFDAGSFSRRNFLRLMGASMALAGVYGCSERPSGKIVPYVQQPEQVVPGMPLFFATAMPLNGFGYGVLVESNEGRPTKIEGNPDHPASLGAANILMQASALQLYDPQRSANVVRVDQISSWEAFRSELMQQLHSDRHPGGKGVRLLTETVTSPTLAWQLDQFRKQFPEARWHHYDPMARVNTQKGAILAFGRPVNTVYQLRRFDSDGKPNDAKVIVSLDSDVLWDEPGSLQYSRHFAAARKVRVRNWWQTTMSRLYVIESTLTLSGSMADHRLPMRPGDVSGFAGALAARLGVAGTSGETPSAWTRHLDAIVSDLKKPENQGATLVLVGESQPPEIHALGHAMNQALGNIGKTLRYTEPVERFPTDTNGQPASSFDSLRELVNDVQHGRVEWLLILEGNPVYTAPADIPLGDALVEMSFLRGSRTGDFANFTAHLGAYASQNSETGYRCQWQVPEAHYLESWGDIQAFDGTASIIQPLIGPMHAGRTAIELMDVLLTPASQVRNRTGYEIVRDFWRNQAKVGQNDFEAWWKRTLEKGVVADSAFGAIDVSISAGPVAPPAMAPSTQATGGELDIVLRPDPSVWDGSYSNNGWLQECPKFFTKLVWDNAALLSPKTAELLRRKYPSTADGLVLTFATTDGRKVDAPVMVVPGLPDNVVTMHFGYGRERGGSATMEPDGGRRGFNAYALRDSRSPWFVSGVSHESTGRFHRLVVTRSHHAMDTLGGFGPPDMRGPLKPKNVEDPATPDDERELENRRLVRTATLAYFNESPEHRHFVAALGAEAERKPLLSLYPGWDYSKGYQWGMSIDMQSCIGCNACLVACVAENNIAVVGRDEVARQREMHWIRIDQYFASSLSKQETEGGADPLANPRIYNQPVPCMQCENAPCELVCPVGATVHSAEGLNEMVYNRCVGTRYCSNNCPYKVRRFNFYNWKLGVAPSIDLQHNPQVTVRTRGVMEKCTYCVQRLNNTRIEIEKMTVQLEDRIRALQEQQKSAAAESESGIEGQISSLRREITTREFDMLERLQTACQQACPTQAIAFGSILPVRVVNESGQTEHRLTQVAKLKQEPLDYPLLAELTTKPRTTYMARLRNPNPDLEPHATS